MWQLKNKLQTHEISLEEKVAYEKEYLQRKSFVFDLRIIVLTFTSVLMSKGVKH